MTDIRDGNDPRLDPAVDPLGLETEAELLVGRSTPSSSPLLFGGIFVVLAVALFLMLNARRVNNAADVLAPAGVQTAALAEPPPLETPAVEPPSVSPALFVQPMPVAVQMPPTAIAQPLSLGVNDLAQRRRAPAVVVDLQPSASPALMQASFSAQAVPGQAVAPVAAAAMSPGGAAAAAQGASAASVAAIQAAASSRTGRADGNPVGEVADAAPQAAVASQLGNLSGIITQGAMLPAVLETAVNSDLAGFARAVVSRDVRSFDGRAVLIPRGSRLIGQYRSAVALGQSRVFVIWTRVIRPDGVSVQIGSPGTDALGRGGLEGEVNRHFFTRFGGSILLSVLNAGVASASRTPATQITIGSPAAAAAAASSASFGQADIAPTISIKQGEEIRIFVARDLDFSGVQPVR